MIAKCSVWIFLLLSQLVFCSDLKYPGSFSFSRTLSLRGGCDNGKQDQALLDQFQSMRNECNMMVQKMSSIESEIEDHQLVESILRNYPLSRRCYRSVGGILMERTVADVLPDIKNETHMLGKAFGDLSKNVKKKQEEMKDFQAEHSIRLMKNGEES
mmetsp:Transcript_382/g.786  ORF Transcript_382/g.786 Transcript_382/m.786 type:complete len:157 (+) Transcript_382:155-625(+)